MLSINIPVYNIDVTDLVSNLLIQAERLNCRFEIRVYDDGSDEAVKIVNREIEVHPNVIYLELPENLGRAAIRNEMGFDSKFRYLLFIDADSILVSENYLENYLQNTRTGCVLCGGTSYSSTEPADPNKMLRWMYGTKREAITAEIRNKNKGFIITSNNFLIEKTVFEKIHFRNLKTYGHEDTLLGYDLNKSNFEILHINNSVEHTGLEDNCAFLEKTKIALKNLHYISNELLNGDRIFTSKVYFLNRYVKITRLIPPFIFRVFYRISYSFIKKNLTGKKPRLFWFDLFKLGYYSTLEQNKNIKNNRPL